MSWLSLAVLSQIIIGSSVVFDKLLLRKREIDPWPYTFWFGVLGLFALILLPFGSVALPFYLLIIALVSGVLFIGAVYFTFSALKHADASDTLALFGAISPIFTLLIGALALDTALGLFDYGGFLLLIASSVALVLFEGGRLRSPVIESIVISGFLLAASHVTAKYVFTFSEFIPAFFWIKMGGVALVLGLLLFSKLRRSVQVSEHASAKSKTLYFLNRTYAAIGSLMVSYAIFLSDPALVDATQNIRYVVIFILAWVILKERFRGRVLAGKLLAACFIALGLLSLSAGEYLRSFPPVSPDRAITWGVTFSDKFARELGLDWQETFKAVSEDLKPKRIRLVAYWDQIEKERGVFDFQNLDWMFRELESGNTFVVLAVGMKMPRWPECHVPEWARELSIEEREAALRTYVREAVLHYQSESQIVMWQVENEPYLNFGECHARGADFLKKEIEVVRALDGRPIVTTDGGEYGRWVEAAREGDVFGTTMYRKIYPEAVGRFTGVIEYPLAPSFFRVKERLVRWWNEESEKPYIVIELQGEPWSPVHLSKADVGGQVASFRPGYFRETIDYAVAADFDEYYLWGAEWWYWMKTKHSTPDYWEMAEEVFQRYD